jgi:hypothetical protein
MQVQVSQEHGKAKPQESYTEKHVVRTRMMAQSMALVAGELRGRMSMFSAMALAVLT